MCCVRACVCVWVCVWCACVGACVSHKKVPLYKVNGEKCVRKVCQKSESVEVGQ